MTHSRQRKPSLALRLCAVVSLLVWVAASGFCSVESLIVADHHADSAAQHDHDAAPASADSDHHSHDSDKNGSDEHSCCDTLKATPQLESSIGIKHPDFNKLFLTDFLALAKMLVVSQPETSIFRQPPDREWVFTPEVCLGPAFRSQAPPVLL